LGRSCCQLLECRARLRARPPGGFYYFSSFFFAALRPWTTHRKVATILVFHLWHNFRFVWKEICQFRTPSRQQQARTSGRQSPFCVSRRPSTVGSWQRDSLERLAVLGQRCCRGTRTWGGAHPPAAPPMMDSFGRFWSLSSTALRTRCG